MNREQMTLPFPARETFFSGRSLIQLKLPFPAKVRELVGISIQLLFYQESEIMKKFCRDCRVSFEIRHIPAENFDEWAGAGAGPLIRCLVREDGKRYRAMTISGEYCPDCGAKMNQKTEKK